MTGRELAAWLGQALVRLCESQDELTDLDAAAGDGDLGATVAGGATAICGALTSLPDSCTPGEVVRLAAAIFAKSNPSSFSALVGAGTLAGSRVFGNSADVDAQQVLEFGRAAAGVIAERGRSDVGDRTILDALVPSLDALASAARATGVEQLDAMIVASRYAVERTAAMVPRRGRAAWVGERTRGFPDAGATAYLRFLEALALERQH